jgi:uncharacterized membrane protein YgdD (TMEM256/DUF423 family)
MNKTFIIAGAIFAATGVALGAFGAHGLQNITQDEKIIRGFQTGVQYQVFHALGLLGLAIIAEKFPNRFIKWAGICFITGIALFSGSLYILTLLRIYPGSFAKIVGPMTPLGGIFFIAGWLFLLAGVWRKKAL